MNCIRQAESHRRAARRDGEVADAPRAECGGDGSFSDEQIAHAVQKSRFRASSHGERGGA